MARRRQPPGASPGLQRSGPWLAVGGLVVLLWLAIASSLFAPWWGVLLNVLLIVPQVFVVRRLARENPRAAPLVPLGGVVLWLAVALVGATLLGWKP